MPMIIEPSFEGCRHTRSSGGELFSSAFFPGTNDAVNYSWRYNNYRVRVNGSRHNASDVPTDVGLSEDQISFLMEARRVALGVKQQAPMWKDMKNFEEDDVPFFEMVAAGNPEAVTHWEQRDPTILIMEINDDGMIYDGRDVGLGVFEIPARNY